VRVTYKITKNSFYEPIKKCKWIYFTFFMYSFIPIYFFFKSNFNYIILLSSVILLIPIILQIILHFDYYLHDKNTIIEIDYSLKKITQTKKLIKTEILFNQIDAIVDFKGSINSDVSSRYAITSNIYSYTVIVDKQKNKIKFTNLILDDLNIYGIEKRVVITPFLNLTNNLF
jgi:hypothetical protein